MAEKKVCFLIPVYPVHFEFLKFLDDINEEDLSFDIYLIISTYEDKRLLLETSYKKIYKIICLEDHIPASFVTSLDRTIITFKKFYGLLWLLEKSPIRYDYVGVVDVEIQFLNLKHVPEKFQTFIDRKTFLGGSVDSGNDSKHARLVRDIHTTVKRLFKEEDLEELKRKTKDFTLYVWFSDIPIYDMEIVPDFFKYINFSFTNYAPFGKIHEYAFDYLIYAFYVLLKKGYSAIDMRDYGIERKWSLESTPFSTYKKVVDKIKYQPLWVIGETYAAEKDYFDQSPIILTYHMNNVKSNTFGEE